MSDSGGIPEIQCNHQDGRPRTRLEMDQWLRKEIPKVHWLRIHACRTLGLPKQISWDMREIVLRHWMLDELVRRQLVIGDMLGVNTTNYNDDSEFRQFTQRLAALTQAGQAIQPQPAEGIDMNGYTPPPPPVMGGAPAPQQPSYPPGPPGVPQQAAPMGPPGYPTQAPAPMGPPGYPAGPPMGAPPMAPPQAMAPPGAPSAGPPAPPAAPTPGRRGRPPKADNQAAPPPPAASPVPPMGPPSGPGPSIAPPQGFAPAGYPPAAPAGFGPPVINSSTAMGIPPGYSGIQTPPSGGIASGGSGGSAQPAPSVDLSALTQKLDHLTELVNKLAADNAQLVASNTIANREIKLLSVLNVVLLRGLYQKPGGYDVAAFLTEMGVQIPQ